MSVIIDDFTNFDAFSFINDGADISTDIISGRMRQRATGGGSSWDNVYRDDGPAYVLGADPIDIWITAAVLNYPTAQDGAQIAFRLNSSDGQVAWEILVTKGTDGLFHVIARDAVGGAYTNRFDLSGVQLTDGAAFRVSVTAGKMGTLRYRESDSDPWEILHTRDLTALAGTVYAATSCSTIAGGTMEVQWEELRHWVEVTSIDVPEAYTGTVVSLTITGIGLSKGTVSGVRLTSEDDDDIAATSVVVVGDDTITCNVDLDGADDGLWDVVVTIDSVDYTGSALFRVKPLPEVVIGDGGGPSGGAFSGLWPGRMKRKGGTL